MLNIFVDAMLIATGQTPPVRRPVAPPAHVIHETDTRRSWFKLPGMRF